MKPRITITINPEILRLAEDAVASGDAKSVSSWIDQALTAQVTQETVQDVMADILEATGGPPTAEERQWAKSVLARSSSTLAR